MAISVTRCKAFLLSSTSCSPISAATILRLSWLIKPETVIVDPERGPLVRLAFELFATGEYSQDEIQEESYDRGLRTRATARYPEQALSIAQIGWMFRNRYYIGYIEYEGEEIKGRHEPLIEEHLFERVQDILESRGVVGDRHRIHHHYLKGSVFCGSCRNNGITQRLCIHEIVRNGVPYTYFFSRRRRPGNSCTSPHINVVHVEQAVNDHYATIRFSRGFIDEVRSHVDGAIAEQEQAERLLHKHLTSELQALDAQENNLIDLAAGGVAQTKIKAKPREIGRQRRHLKERLATVNDDLSDGARLIEACLRLLEDPQALYRRSDDETRRLLNQAIFHELYIDEDGVTGSELKEPFAQLHSLQKTRELAQADKPDPGGSNPATAPLNVSGAVSQTGDGPADASSLQVILGPTNVAQVFNKAPKVGDTGFEPVTSSV
jgi:site-specific DNA recombinase